jgi:hypothetical protein
MGREAPPDDAPPAAVDVRPTRHDGGPVVAAASSYSSSRPDRLNTSSPSVTADWKKPKYLIRPQSIRAWSAIAPGAERAAARG